MKKPTNLLNGLPYVKRTDVAQRFREMGWEPPEKRAEEIEVQARHDGALLAMKRIQLEEAAKQTQPVPIKGRKQA